MRVWLPYVIGGSGVDVYTKLLARGLKDAGHDPIVRQVAHNFQYFPWLLRQIPAPEDFDLVLTNSWNGFAFRRSRIPLIVVEHHCIFDHTYIPYRSIAQSFFHETLVRRFERWSFGSADAVVAVSSYTADKVVETFPGTNVHVIHNGIDIDFYFPAPNGKESLKDRPFRLLFVGNLSSRKGLDLLPRIVQQLGLNYELSYTSGLRSNDKLRTLNNVCPLRRISNEELRSEYQNADALLFPSRLEGFGYAAAEAMACGTPVVTTRGSSLPEIVEHGVTGYLCERDAVDQFVSAIRLLAGDSENRLRMGRKAREVAVARFSLKRMVDDYVAVFTKLIEQDIDR